MALIGELATSLVSSALFEAARRPVNWVTSSNLRRREIGRAIEGQKSHLAEKHATNVAKSFDDLVQVLGNEYGQYTESVDAFLKELKSSSIPATIYRAAIVGKSPDQIYPAFKLLYDSFSPLPFDANQLFRAYDAAVRTRIAQSLGDPFAADLIRAQIDELREQIGGVLSSFAQSASVKPLPAEKFIDCRNRLAKAIELNNRDIPVETDRGTKRISISRLVIPARLRRAEIGSSGLSVNDRPERDAISLIEFRRGLHRAVVLGDPGGGKSTLTQLLCYEMARRLSLDSRANNSKIDERDLRLPLRIIVRTYDRKQRNTPGYSILDYLRDELKTSLDNDPSLTEAFLKETLATGKAVLLFDGLDEVLEVGRRREMAGYIEQFLNANAACPALVTSRLVGYGDAPMARDFDLYALSRLDTDEVALFAEKLIKVIGGRNVDPKEKSLEFIRQTDTHASDLRANPLLLGLMVYIFHERGDVPDNRPEIYKACSQLLFLKWDQRRDILFEYPDDFELLDLFGHLAVKIFGNPETEDGVSYDWLLGQVRGFFADWYSDKARAAAAAKALVSFITGRAWVMCDVGPSVYKFTHRTFMEYFVARRLESESESVLALLEKLYPHVVKGEWDVVSHLALQIAASSGPKAVMAVSGLHSLLESKSRNSKDERNFVLFAAKALEYLPVPEGDYSKIVGSLMDRATRLGSTDISAITIFSTLLKSAKKKIQVLEDLMTRHVDRTLRNSDVRTRRFGQYVMCAQGETFFSRQYIRLHPGTAHGLKLWDAMERIRRSHEADLFEEARRDPAVARIYLVTYQKRVEELWQAHGARLLFDAYDPTATEEFNSLRFVILEEAVFGGMRLSGGARDIERLIGLVADEAERSGIEIETPIASAGTGRRDARAYLDEIFRALFHYSRRGAKTSPTLVKGYRQALIYAFACLEFEALVNPGMFGLQRAKAFAPERLRERLIGRSMPQDLLREMALASDAAAGTVLLQSWIDGGVDLLKVRSKGAKRVGNQQPS